MGGVRAFGFNAALDAIERRMVRDLKLESVPAFGEWSERTGSWKGDPVRWRAIAWEGPRVGLFRTVRVSSEGLEIVNVLAWARAPLAAPILGIDLVAARHDSAIVVADLSPLDPTPTPNAALPAWAQRIFSPTPIVERVTVDSAPSVLDRVQAMTANFVTLVLGAGAADPCWRDAAIERYRLAHLDDERMRTMLNHMFGAAHAERLLHTVLFPRESSLDVHA
jgi:hypothetical protein